MTRKRNAAPRGASATAKRLGAVAALGLGALGAGATPFPAAAQSAECRWAESVSTGARVYVCRDAAGRWRLSEPGQARPSIARPPRVLTPEQREVAARERAEAEARRERLASFQRALNDIGCAAGVADGVWGAQTRAAARCFQARIGARTTGRLTASEAERLLAIAAVDPDRAPQPEAPSALEPQPQDPAPLAQEPAVPPTVADAPQTPSAPILGEPGAFPTTPDLNAPALGDTALAPPPPSPPEPPTARSVSGAALADRTDAAPEPESPPPAVERIIAPAKPAAPAETAEAESGAPLAALSQPAPGPFDQPAETAAEQASRDSAALEQLLGLSAGQLDTACRDGMRIRQTDNSPWASMFNRVCRAHAYAANDTMLMLGYDARLAAEGDPVAQAAMERRKADR